MQSTTSRHTISIVHPPSSRYDLVSYSTHGSKEPMRYLMAMMFAGSMLLGVNQSFSANWKPANGPLMTRWTKDVSPTDPHPEYPRPQLVRKDWMNLNGMWEIQFAGEEKPVPILVPFPPESALSGVMRHGEHVIYRRKFEV